MSEEQVRFIYKEQPDEPTTAEQAALDSESLREQVRQSMLDPGPTVPYRRRVCGCAQTSYPERTKQVSVPFEVTASHVDEETGAQIITGVLKLDTGPFRPHFSVNGVDYEAIS